MEPLLQPVLRDRAPRWYRSVFVATCFPSSSVAARSVFPCTYCWLIIKDTAESIRRNRTSVNISIDTASVTTTAVLDAKFRSQNGALIPAGGHCHQRQLGTACVCLQHGAVSDSGDVGEGLTVCVLCRILGLLSRLLAILLLSNQKVPNSSACWQFQNMQPAENSKHESESCRILRHYCL